MFRKFVVDSYSKLSYGLHLKKSEKDLGEHYNQRATVVEVVTECNFSVKIVGKSDDYTKIHHESAQLNHDGKDVKYQ